MFDDTRAAGSTGWAVVAGGLLGAGFASLACGGLFFDLLVADRWAAWFPEPDWLLRDDVVALPTDLPTAVRWPE